MVGLWQNLIEQSCWKWGMCMLNVTSACPQDARQWEDIAVYNKTHKVPVMLFTFAEKLPVLWKHMGYLEAPKIVRPLIAWSSHTGVIPQHQNSGICWIMEQSKGVLFESKKKNTEIVAYQNMFTVKYCTYVQNKMLCEPSKTICKGTRSCWLAGRRRSPLRPAGCSKDTEADKSHQPQWWGIPVYHGIPTSIVHL